MSDHAAIQARDTALFTFALRLRPADRRGVALNVRDAPKPGKDGRSA